VALPDEAIYSASIRKDFNAIMSSYWESGDKMQKICDQLYMVYWGVEVVGTSLGN